MSDELKPCPFCVLWIDWEGKWKVTREGLVVPLYHGRNELAAVKARRRSRE